MPGVDWIPGVSQLKSVVQAVTGDTEGAKQTLINFSRECPGVAQATSLVQFATGDAEGAWETQKICLGTVNNIANGIPVVGHAKGVVHHIVGDHEGGNQALNAATRSAVVIGSGAAVGIATGGLGAILAGIAAGATYDATATVLTGEDQGYIAAFKHASENPSGGSIFDAVALPVGDGLAGYAGGQMANKIKLSSMEAANKAKIQSLEASRQAKLDTLNTIMDHPGTDGAAMKFEAEINQIFSKINTIMHEMPHCSTDVESKSASPDAASAFTSGTAGLPVAYADQSTQGETITRVISEVTREGDRRPTSINTEDALYHESYVDSSVTACNLEARRQSMRALDNQQAQEHIGEAYKNVGFSTPAELESLLKLINEDPDGNPQWKGRVIQLLKGQWLFLHMPEEFPYTVTVQLSSMIHGYYHSLIRHMDDWGEVISFDNTLINRLRPLMVQIRGCASASDVASGTRAREDFLTARQQLTRAEYNDVQTALAEVQLSMHSFMQANMTYSNYEGRTVTAGDQEQLFFRVRTRSGNARRMVVCLSSERHTSEAEDERPLRLLVTVFFRPW